jgi:hypothetical protein
MNNFAFHPASFHSSSPSAEPSTVPSSTEAQFTNQLASDSAMESLDKSFAKCNIIFNKPFEIQLPVSEHNMSWSAVRAIVKATSKLKTKADLLAFNDSEEYNAMVTLKDEPRPSSPNNFDVTKKTDDQQLDMHLVRMPRATAWPKSGTITNAASAFGFALTTYAYASTKGRYSAAVARKTPHVL